MYKTLVSPHELGSDMRPHDYAGERADGWDCNLKVVSDANHAAELSPVFSTDAVRVMRWWVWNGFRSDSIDGWIGTDNPESSARRWVNHMRQQLDILKNTGHVWYVEVFNEVGISETHCRFDVEVAKELKRIYGDQIRLAALSMSSGTYNDQKPQWDLMVNSLIKPLNAAGCKFMLSLHAYSSWLHIVGNWPGLQHGDLAARFPNIPWKDLQMDDAKPFDIKYSGDRYDWTGFAIESLIRYLDKFGLAKTPIGITEFGIDMMGPIAGVAAGGHFEWAERGVYNFLTKELGIDVETLIGRCLWYAERRFRAINAGGGNVIAVFPFTWGDQDQNSRWYRHYRHRGGIFNMFKYLARTSAGQEKPPVVDTGWPADNRHYAKTLTSTQVNIRPEWNTLKASVAQMNPGNPYLVTHKKVLDSKNIWLRIEYKHNTWAWAAYRYNGAPITQLNKPIDDMPEWGGTVDANDTAWENPPAEEEPPVIEEPPVEEEPEKPLPPVDDDFEPPDEETIIPAPLVVEIRDLVRIIEQKLTEYIELELNIQ